MTSHDLLEVMRELDARGAAHALVTVVRAIAPTSAQVGARAIVLADGSLHGWIGGGCAKHVVVGAALAAIKAGEPRLVRITNDEVQDETGIERHVMSCASNGTVELFIQPFGARASLCVLGGTPAAEEARFLATRLGLGVADAPGEAPVVLVATQGQGDEAALESALRGRARVASSGLPQGPAPSIQAHATHAAVPNGKFLNPVCGAPIDMATALHVEQHAGESYYFCCDGCWTAFRQDPEKYAAIHRASLAKA